MSNYANRGSLHDMFVHTEVPYDMRTPRLELRQTALYSGFCLSVSLSVSLCVCMCVSVTLFYNFPITGSSWNFQQTVILWNACGTYDFKSKGQRPMSQGSIEFFVVSAPWLRAYLTDLLYTWHEYSPCCDNVSCSISESKGQRSRSHRSCEMNVTPVIRSFCRVRSMAASIFGWITSHVAYIQHTRGRRVILHFQDGRSKVMVTQVVLIAGTLGCVFIDNETHESGVSKCTTGETWSAFSWHHSSVFRCQWTHNQVFLLLSHMLI